MDSSEWWDIIVISTKVLENLTALSIAEGLSQLIKEESQRLEKVYQEMSRKFSENWKESENQGLK